MSKVSQSNADWRTKGKLPVYSFKTLLILGMVFVALSGIAFATGCSINPPNKAMVSAVSSSSAAASSSADASSSSASANATSVKDVQLTAATSYLEYSNKTVDPLTLVKCSDPNAKVSAKGEIDLSKVGEQKVKYVVSLGGQSADKELTFTVRDTKAPVITLTESNPSFDKGGEFDPTAYVKSVEDSVDGTLGFVDSPPDYEGTKTAGLEPFYDEGWYAIDGTIETDAPGTYSFTITASDKHGNVSTKELLATVNEVAEPEPVAEQSAKEYTYIANLNSHKFHRPTCKDVKKMKESNKWEVTTTREDMIDMGYEPCGHCNP